MTTLRALAFALACGVAVCAAAPRPAHAAECPPEQAPHAFEPVHPLNIDKIKEQLRDYHSHYYAGDVSAVLADAQAYVQQRAGEVARPALVLDIDETSLSNWRNLSADDFGFISKGPCNRLPDGPCGFNAWVLRAEAEAIEPTLALFNAAKAKGVSVFFVTARPKQQRHATVLNLHRAGYRGWTELVLRDASDTKRSVQDYKTEMRSKIAARGFAIIANVGDQRSDLDGGYADCTFKVANPFYFIR